jgi:hypothetical protein
MAKLLLMSVVLATAIIPAIVARDPKPRRALRRAMFGMVAFNAIYAVLVIFVYPQICWN